MSQAILPWSDAVTSEPAVEPVTVEDAKRNSDIVGDSWDIDVQRWIQAARKKVEDESRLCLVTQTRARKFDSLPCGRIISLRKPLVSVSSIQYKDTSNNTQTYSTDDYEVDTARSAVFRKVTSSWPSVGDSPNVLTVNYICGAAATAVDVRAIQAILLLVKHWYEEAGAYSATDLRLVPDGYTSLVLQLKEGQYP